jgi:hypothetical protein
MATTNPEPILSAESGLLAVIALLADEREQRIKGSSDSAKTEAILFRAGLNANQIAAATGKTIEAVRKSLQRQKKTK